MITTTVIKIVTDLERDIMRAILLQDHRDGRDARAQIWVDCILDKAELAKRSSLGGVMTSLKRKGIADSDGECAWLTDAGIAIYFMLGDLTEQELEILNREATDY